MKNGKCLISLKLILILRSEKFQTALAQLAACPTASLNLLASEPFQKLLKIANPACPLPTSNNGIKSVLLKEAATVQEELKSELQKVKGSITLTIDLWTDSAMLHGYVGITAHFIQGHYWFFVASALRKSLDRILLRRSKNV